MYIVLKTFVCRGCVNSVTGIGCTTVDIGGYANLELVDKFCYLGDMLSVSAHPGCPGQDPEIHKTVVYMCVSFACRNIVNTK